MKPNGRMFVVRAVLLVTCAAGLFYGVAGAETVHGTFRLPVRAYWGRMVLSPGEYEFTIDTGSTTRMLLVRSEDSSRAGMVLCSSINQVRNQQGSSLRLDTFEGGVYVERLSLGDAGVALTFDRPKALTRLARSEKATWTSASGSN